MIDDLVAQRRLHSLRQEQEHLHRAKPTDAGWGETQRRLRENEREIQRLQAQLEVSDTPGEGEEDLPPTAEFQEAIEEYNELRQDIADMEGEVATINEILHGEVDTFTRRAKGIRQRLLERDKLPPARARLAELAKFLNLPESA